MTSRRSKRASFRLDPAVRPERVDLRIEVDPAASDVYRGEVSISLKLARAVKIIRLHARDLRIESTQLSVRGRRVGSRSDIRPGSDVLEIRLDSPAPAGRARLSISFEGRLRTDLSGFYGVRVGERRYGFTQLEATDARKFFPCFDEPAMKARFRIRVTTAAANSVISNAPAERTEIHADGRVTTCFAETPPLSTYLVALAVGELESSPAERVGPTEVRVWHVPGKERLTGFGLEAARECLTRLEDWFAIP